MIRRLPNTSRDHSVNLTRMLLNIREVGSLGRQHVTLAPSCVDQRLIRAMIDLPAQAHYVDIYDVGKGIEVLVPNVLGNLTAAEDLTLVKHQQLEQGIFLRGEFDEAIAASRRVVHGVER